MATPTPAAQLPTRQQLDEIDALLRRMLSLAPLAGEATPESAPAAAPPTPAPVSFPTPAIREVSIPHQPAPGEPRIHEWRVGWTQPAAPQPSVFAWGSAVPMATLAEAPVPPAYQPPAYLNSPSPAMHAGLFPAPAQPVASPITPTLWPLIALNFTFNLLTYLLGPLGTWLRGPGRTFLGWLGVGMIVAAGVWAAGEWYGYDWPKVDLAALAARLGLSV